MRRSSRSVRQWRRPLVACRGASASTESHSGLARATSTVPNPAALRTGTSRRKAHPILIAWLWLSLATASCSACWLCAAACNCCSGPTFANCRSDCSTGACTAASVAMEARRCAGSFSSPCTTNTRCPAALAPVASLSTTWSARSSPFSLASAQDSMSSVRSSHQTLAPAWHPAR